MSYELAHSSKCETQTFTQALIVRSQYVHLFIYFFFSIWIVTSTISETLACRRNDFQEQFNILEIKEITEITWK